MHSSLCLYIYIYNCTNTYIALSVYIYIYIHIYIYTLNIYTYVQYTYKHAYNDQPFHLLRPPVGAAASTGAPVASEYADSAPNRKPGHDSKQCGLMAIVFCFFPYYRLGLESQYD